MSVTFSVLLPIKPPGTGKSRLVVGSGDLRHDLVIAFARDVVAALRGARTVSEVWVIGESVENLEVAALPDQGGGDLNLAVTRAAASIDGPVAVLLPDLPALRGAEIDLALAHAGQVAGTSFVADHTGTGTTLLAATEGGLRPAFGPGSAARHKAAGAVPILEPLPGLRLDVDTREDLEAARLLGLGNSTAAVLPRGKHRRR